MQNQTSWKSILGASFVPVLFFAIFCVSAGIGIHRVVHMSRAADFLAHDPGCKTDLSFTTPASESAGCRIVHGRIVSAHEETRGTQYGGGIAYDQYLDFAPPNGGPPVEFRTERFYSHQEQPPPGPAVAEYVDGEIDYLTSASAKIGPIFDPEDDAGFGWFLIGLGVFFLAVGAFTALMSYLVARRLAKRRAEFEPPSYRAR
jgi:hypothetical protein